MGCFARRATIVTCGSYRTEWNSTLRITASRRTLVGMCNQTAFGGMLQGIVELASIVLQPEPLDTEIERRCKRALDEAPCPDCGETAIQTRDDSPRVWCSSCRYVFTYTRNTPFEGRTLTPGEILIAFALYADTLLSINQIAQLFDSVYDTIHTTIRWKSPLSAASTSSGHGFKKILPVQPRLTKPVRTVLASKDRRRRGTASPAAARVIQADHAGKVHQVIQ